MAWHWLEVGGSAWLFYYASWTAYNKAKDKGGKASSSGVVDDRGLCCLFLKLGVDHHSDFIKLLGSGKLAPELEEGKTRRKTESYVLRLFRIEEDGKLVDLGIELWISKVVSSGADSSLSLGFRLI